MKQTKRKTGKWIQPNTPVDLSGERTCLRPCYAWVVHVCIQEEREGIYRLLLLLCKSCTKFHKTVQFICQRFPDSHTGLAIGTVWRKLCVLGIQSGLCGCSRNDARAQVRLQMRPVPSWRLRQCFSLSWIATLTKTVSLSKGQFYKSMSVCVPKYQVVD